MPFGECAPVLRIDSNFLSANTRKNGVISEIHEHVSYNAGRVAKWMRIRERRVTATRRLRYSRGEVEMRSRAKIDYVESNKMPVLKRETKRSMLLPQIMAHEHGMRSPLNAASDYKMMSGIPRMWPQHPPNSPDINPIEDV